MENDKNPIKYTAINDYSHPADTPDILNQKRQRKRLAVTCILILLFAAGLVINEADFMGESHTTALQYLEVYSAFLPLLIYIVPFGIIMKRIRIKYEMERSELLTAVFCGAFIPAAFAGELNGGFDDLMNSLMGSSYSDSWIGSAEAGVAEELLKLATTAILVYVLNRKSLKQYLMIGMCVGMGFQIEEDIAYITGAGFENVNDAFPTALDRISGALGSHWAYASVTAAGLYLIVWACSRNHSRKGIGRGIGWILFVMADHFLYDTPLGDSLLINAVLTAAVVLPVMIFFKNTSAS